jgi:hypothetical protein
MKANALIGCMIWTVVVTALVLLAMRATSPVSGQIVPSQTPTPAAVIYLPLCAKDGCFAWPIACPGCAEPICRGRDCVCPTPEVTR